MMIKAFFTAIVFFVISLPALSQLTVTGKILDSGNKPIPYANIGILYTSVGTISNEDGSFSIDIPATHTNEDLLFSAIGYGRKTIPVSSLATGKAVTIYLLEKISTLNTVTVTAKKEKKKAIRFGHRRSLLLSGQLYWDTTSAGSAMALLIHNTRYPDFIFPESASLWIAKNKSPQFKVRLRFLEVDSANHNLPGDDIFNESIVITSDIEKGWLDFDLSSYQYQINRPSFYLMFEWILEDKDRQYIADQYDEYIKSYPDRVNYDTVVIDGEKVPIIQTSTVLDYAALMSCKEETNYLSLALVS